MYTISHQNNLLQPQSCDFVTLLSCTLPTTGGPIGFGIIQFLSDNEIQLYLDEERPRNFDGYKGKFTKQQSAGKAGTGTVAYAGVVSATKANAGSKLVGVWTGDSYGIEFLEFKNDGTATSLVRGERESLKWSLDASFTPMHIDMMPSTGGPVWFGIIQFISDKEIQVYFDEERPRNFDGYKGKFTKQQTAGKDGTSLLLQMTKHRNIPAVKLGDVNSTMNLAQIRVEGVAETDARMFRSGGMGFNFSDGTGTIMVFTSQEQAREMVERNLVPKAGDQVSFAGGLNIAGSRSSMRLLSIDEFHVVRVTPAGAVSATRPSEVQLLAPFVGSWNGNGKYQGLLKTVDCIIDIAINTNAQLAWTATYEQGKKAKKNYKIVSVEPQRLTATCRDASYWKLIITMTTNDIRQAQVLSLQDHWIGNDQYGQKVYGTIWSNSYQIKRGADSTMP